MQEADVSSTPCIYPQTPSFEKRNRRKRILIQLKWFDNNVCFLPRRKRRRRKLASWLRVIDWLNELIKWFENGKIKAGRSRSRLSRRSPRVNFEAAVSGHVIRPRSQSCGHGATHGERERRGNVSASERGFQAFSARGKRAKPFLVSCIELHLACAARPTIHTASIDTRLEGIDNNFSSNDDWRNRRWYLTRQSCN